MANMKEKRKKELRDTNWVARVNQLMEEAKKLQKEGKEKEADAKLDEAGKIILSWRKS